MEKNRKHLKGMRMLLLACAVSLPISTPVKAVSGNDVSGPPELTATPLPQDTVSPTPTPDTPTPTFTPTPPAQPKKGWNTTADGRKRYYRGGKYLKGLASIGKKQYFFDKSGYLLQDAWATAGKKTYRTDSKGIIIKDKLITVDKKVYYMNAKGVMKKGWKTFKAGKSYFGEKGVRATGIKKIGKNRYYFNKKGIMQKGTVKAGSTIYYLDEKGVLEARKEGTTYYYADGKKMDKVQGQDFETLQTAKSIVVRITTSQMSKSQKLKACFDWVISKPYVTYRQFSNFAGWPAVYANDHFLRNGGNCHADASAFAYLAKALGYKNVYVCTDSEGRSGLAHGWTEIGGLVYDPLFAEAKNYSQNYGVPYGVYALHPILHIAI